jgi:hypothetical protein
MWASAPTGDEILITHRFPKTGIRRGDYQSPGGTRFYNRETDAKTHLRPSSVTCGDTFSQREKAFGLCRTKGFSLWGKVAAQRTDEGCRSP